MTLKVDEIQNTSGGAVTLTKQEATKMFVNFDGDDSGSPSARKSFNTSSFTDNGTGQFRISMTNAMADSNFGALGSCIGDGSTNNRTVAHAGSRGSHTTSIFDVNTARADTDAQVDWTHNTVAVLGDLA